MRVKSEKVLSVKVQKQIKKEANQGKTFDSFHPPTYQNQGSQAEACNEKKSKNYFLRV